MQSQASRQGVYVLFSPGFQQRAKSVQPGLAWGMLEEDAALLHELFHALRILQGRLNLSPMITTMEKSTRAKAETYRNREELYATVVQNIYSAELGRNALRENYNNLTQAGNYLSGRTIAEDYEFELNALISRMCRFAFKVASVPTKYNPIRDLLHKKSTVLRNACNIS